MSCSISIISDLAYVNGKEVSVWDIVDSYTGSLKVAKKIDGGDE